MKNKTAAFLVFSLLFTYILCFPCVGAASSSSSPEKLLPPPVTAETAIVADADTGYIYYDKSIHKQMYPASITKILTGLAAVEKGNDSDMITVPDTIQNGMPSNAARICLVGGEKVTQEEALYTMFLASANDSANLLAYHIGGSMDNFVAIMNATAKKLGAVDSHFANASGLPDPNNVTSAYDMAIITKKALETPALMKYFGATSYTMPATNMHKKAVPYSTLQKMMKNTVYKYDGVIAGKTGWETMSGHTLVTAARRNGRTLICVVMKSSDSHAVYNDSIALLDYGFSASCNAQNPQYLKAPAVAAKIAPVKDDAPKLPVKKQDEQNAGAQNQPALPLLMLAFIVCFAAFICTCGHNISKSRYAKSRAAQTASYTRHRSKNY